MAAAPSLSFAVGGVVRVGVGDRWCSPEARVRCPPSRLRFVLWDDWEEFVAVVWAGVAGVGTGRMTRRGTD